MSDPKEKLVPARLFWKTMDLVKDRQRAAEKAGLSTPTVAQVIDTLVNQRTHVQPSTNPINRDIVPKSEQPSQNPAITGHKPPQAQDRDDELFDIDVLISEQAESKSKVPVLVPEELAPAFRAFLAAYAEKDDILNQADQFRAKFERVKTETQRIIDDAGRSDAADSEDGGADLGRGEATRGNKPKPAPRKRSGG